MTTPESVPDPAMLAGMADLLVAMRHRKPAAAVDRSVVNELVSEAGSPSGGKGNDPLAAAPWRALGLDGVERGRVFEAMFQVPAQEQKLGRYVVLGTLGHGGMGVVLEAFDRTLDRRVAIKVLRKELDDEQTKRLLREAQAMAKLSHPNVVQVYEAGEAEGQAFVAMELVQGQMLGAWMRQEPRPDWRACVKMFIRLGAGLAAAHERGLIHRDFKPGNAIVDDDGRPRVLDFGLARKAESEQDDESDRLQRARTAEDTSVLNTPLTRAGTVMGTPAYMPPEQMCGHDTDARSDQFSFCVSLYEAVYGERPFAGDALEALMVSIASGAVQPVPKGSKVPAKLRVVLLRGLAIDPAQRWPSMEALLGELRKLVALRTRRGLVLGLTVGLVGMGAAVGVPQYLEMQARCSGAGAELDGVWDEVRRQEVEDAVLGTGLSYAADTWERIEPALDGYAQAWVGKHTEVCEATSVRGDQTEEAMALRMGCLHERKVALGAAVTVLGDADATVVEKAVQLVEALPSMDRCDDLERMEHMRQRVPPPEDPQVEAEVEALREELAGIRAEHEAGRYAEALEHVEPVVQRAEALGYGPLLAEALAQRGYARRENDILIEAERDLEQAFTLAVEHRHDTVMATTVIGLAWVVGVQQGRHEPGFGWGRTALALSGGSEEATAARGGSLTNIGAILQMQGKFADALSHLQCALALYEQAFGKQHSSLAAILDNIGVVLQEQGKLENALTQYQRALAIKEQAFGKQHSSVARTLTNIGVVLQEQGKLEDALSHHQRALAIKEQAFGKQHSSVAAILTDIGVVLQEQGKLEDALSHHQRALAIKEQAFGKQHSAVAATLDHIGIILREQGKFEDALTHLQRALTIKEPALGKRHSSVAGTLTNIGIVLQLQGKLEEALIHYQRALAIDEQALGEHHSSVAKTLGNIGIVLETQGKLEEAVTHYQRALAIDEQALGKHHPDLAQPLVGLANVTLDQGKFDIARAHAERAVSIRDAGKVAPPLLAEARFALACVLWSNRAERKRAHALAQQARDVFAKHGQGREAALAEVDAWLDEHRLR